MSRSEEFDSGYRMQHQTDASGDPMHDVENSFPDIHQHPEYYHHGGRSYDESLRAIRTAKGKPDAQVTIYRAVPPGIKDINPGDWVTPSKAYAKQHGMHATDPKQDMPVISKKVPARHLRTEANDVNEWAYFPEDKR